MARKGAATAASAAPAAESAPAPRPVPTSRGTVDLTPRGTSADGTPAAGDNADTVDAAMEAFIAGNTGAAADPGDDDGDDDAPDDTGDTEDAEPGDDDDAGEDETPDGDGDADVAPGATAAGAKPGRPPNKETVSVTDEQGRRGVEVDFTDRAKMRRYVQQAHGAMKLYAREQKAVARADAAEKLAASFKERADTQEAMETVFATEGVDGLLRRVTATKDLPGGKSLDDLLTERAARARWLADPSRKPAELETYYKREATEEARRVANLERAKIEQERSGVRKEQADALTAKLEAVVVPAYQKMRFHGKLGDPMREAKMDAFLWKELQTGLDSLFASGVKDISPETAVSLLQDAVDTLGGGMEQGAAVLADRKAKKAKANAQAAVATTARRGAQSLAQQAAAPTPDAAFFDSSSLADLMFQSMQQGKNRRRRG